MQLTCVISLGELIDKLTILEIKKDKIKDGDKLKYIENEKNILTKTLDLQKIEGYQNLKDSLFEINLKLWEIEDKIREKEYLKVFDQSFIDLARSVYITNDKRFELKKQINEKYGSAIHEVKSYKSY